MYICNFRTKLISHDKYIIINYFIISGVIQITFVIHEKLEIWKSYYCHFLEFKLNNFMVIFNILMQNNVTL